ncbi:MAG: TfuA-like protein [Methanosarcinales archaeon]
MNKILPSVGFYICVIDSYGMIGVGCTYEWYRDGVIESDDEVAVTFHPETLQPLSIPLVNIKAMLEYAVDKDMIDPHKRDMLLKIGIVSISVQDELIDFFVNNEVDVKQDDALMVIDKIRQLL